MMSALLENGIDVTALHNHFFWDEQHVYYMHVHGMGKTVDLAHKVKPALDLIGHLSPDACSVLIHRRGPRYREACQDYGA